MQFLLPFLSEYMPGLHVMQEAELVDAISPLKVPAWQSVHTAVPLMLAKEPGAHGLQEVDAVWLDVSNPRGHARQRAAAAFDLYVPESQKTQYPSSRVDPVRPV